uniref:Uncharacterized protein n=1 Tax=Amphimedon queenslandica TaxID=400682 RepID=A0A1X7UG84_AMPQE
MSSTTETILDKELGINDFRLVWEKASVLSRHWDSTGIMLGLSPNKLDEIEAGGRSPKTCLRKVFECWLRKEYDQSSGVPTLRMLCNCIRSESGGADPALADEIVNKYSKSSEQQPLSPVETNSFREVTPNTELQTPLTSPDTKATYASGKSKEFPVNDILKQIDELQLVHNSNMYKTREAFCSLKRSTLPKVIDFIQCHIIHLLSPYFRKEQFIDKLREEYDSIKSMNQLFKVLEKRVSWFNFELIVLLVQVFIPDREVQRIWSTYSDLLKDYFKNNNDRAIKVVNGIEFGILDAPGTEVMIAKVANDDYTLNDLYFFHKAIAEALAVSEYKFYFCQIDDGCMELKYSISNFLYLILFPLTNQQCHSLAEIGIIKLSCNEYVHEMEQLPENELRKLSHSTIDINDPLWYENTSTPLIEACWRGLKDEVQWLMDESGSQERGTNGWNPLLAASYGGHIDVLYLLIDVYHCNPSQSDDDGVISLHMASYKGHLNIAQYLVNECHVDPDIADSSCNTGLLYSALGGHVDLVIMFLKKKCNVSQSGQVALVHQLKQFGIFSEDDVDFNGCGIVHYCAMSDSVELLEYLYNNVVLDIRGKDCFDTTPLHIACQYASSGFIMKAADILGYKVLLEADYSGCSSLHYLCSGLVDKYCITEVYNKLTAPCDIPLLMQFSTLDFFVKKEWHKYISLNINVTEQHKRVSLLSTLLKKTSVLEEYGINTSSLDYEGRSAVHYAALSGSPTLLSYTVSEYRLNASQPDYKGVVPLALACMSGSINAVEYIMNTTDTDINITCNEGKTPFNYSCWHGNLELSQYLCEIQDSGIHLDDDGYSIKGGNMKLVQYLIENHHLLLTPESLIEAIDSTKLPLVKLLINEYKLDPHVEYEDGKSAVEGVTSIDLFEYLVNDCSYDLGEEEENNWNIFHFAAAAGHYPIIKHIIDNYPQYTSLLHLTEDNNTTTLHLACSGGVVQLVTFLIDEMKCDESTEDMNGLNCVTWACTSGNLDLLKLLIKQYKHNPRIYSLVSSLYVAVTEGHVHILEWLRQEHHINVASFKNGVLPFTAARYNRLYCLKHLLNNYSFDINATDPRNDTQSTLLHIACQEGHVATVLYLTSLPQCDVSAKTSNGSTVLHLSCKSRSLPILKHLVEEHQLDLTIKDYNGMAPVHVACEEGSLSIVKPFTIIS